MSTGLRLFGSSAALDHKRRYRYALWRTWEADAPSVMFVGLNPSTADEADDDPTIRRCIGFARSWGFGGVVMANLYAYRATDRRVLREADDPVGELNDDWLARLSREAGRVIAAWGADPGPDSRRPARAMDLLGELHVLGLTKAQAPRHPLYVRGDVEPVRWSHA